MEEAAQRRAVRQEWFWEHSSSTAVYAGLSALACAAALINEGAEPFSAAGLFVLLGSSVGQLCLTNLCVSVWLLTLHGLQRTVFGRLRAIESQRLWERLVSYLMGQLVVLGAVVEPDLAELALWASFSTLVGVLGLYAGARPKPGPPRRRRTRTLPSSGVCSHSRVLVPPLQDWRATVSSTWRTFPSCLPPPTSLQSSA